MPHWRRYSAVLVTVLLFSPALGMAAEAGEGYIHEDVILSGRELNSFTVGDETVNVLLGDFSLTLGKRRITGRDAVLWMRERQLGNQTLRDIQVYVEGDDKTPAKVVEAGGATTTDRVIVVSLRQQGLLRAKVDQNGTADLKSLPMFARAEQMRKQEAERPKAEPPVAVFQPPAAPRAAGTAPTAVPAATGPAIAHGPSGGEPTTLPLAPERTPAAPAATRRTPAPSVATRPAAPRPIETVTFRANVVTSEERPDPLAGGATRRITTARGSVYLAQGNPDSDLFLEMRADAAVIYSEPMGKTAPAPAGAIPGQEKVTGAYMEGDVILRRGERTVTGDRLFYDFQTGKAIFINPVLRTVQEQRNIPIYIRAKEGRQLEARAGAGGLRVAGSEWSFKDAVVTTSDFYTPSYAIAARNVYLRDETTYDETGAATSERKIHAEMKDSTFDIGGVPLFWVPLTTADGEEGHTALKKLTFGKQSHMGWGVETEWFLFRLLGVPRPEGFKGRFDLDWSERGALAGADVEYTRKEYSGEFRVHGVLDQQAEDDFGTDVRNIEAREERGRLVWRHKQFLPHGWEVQGELAYNCDRNFLRAFFPGEFWTDKEQETLLYVKKQQDNWAITGLAQWRLNDFETTTEAFPDIGGYLLGQELLHDSLTYYGEAHVGLVRWRPNNQLDIKGSGTVGRADMRHELDAPLAIGPVKLLPYAVGRVTAWCDTPEEGSLWRPWGQVGLNAKTDVWRIYPQVESRLWDLHKLKHVVTPYGNAFVSGAPTVPDDVFPFSPQLEQYVRRMAGSQLGVRNLLQTKRGPAESRQTADWLRVNLYAAWFDSAEQNNVNWRFWDPITPTGPAQPPADGRFFFYRPEYSVARNSVNGDMQWSISDSTSLTGDFNYDSDTGRLGRADVGLAVQRDPRLRWYAGLRKIRDLDSAMGTLGRSTRSTASTR